MDIPTIHDEIDKAVAAHQAWKQKLNQAIETGECESTPERVKKDNNCSFGKWLHERIDPEAKGTPYYNEILALHAQFHREAGGILEIALSGDKKRARKLMGLGSDFSNLSANLVTKMRWWKTTLK